MMASRSGFVAAASASAREIYRNAPSSPPSPRPSVTSVSMIPPEVIEQIREAADMVQLIGEHVELKRTGADWRGPCPFHGGTHRNFSVVLRKQMYHCFVCHESGDVLTFWMKKFGLDYPAAVREIAGRVGIEVPEARQAGPDPNEPLYSPLPLPAHS